MTREQLNTDLLINILMSIHTANIISAASKDIPEGEELRSALEEATERFKEQALVSTALDKIEIVKSSNDEAIKSFIEDLSKGKLSRFDTRRIADDILKSMDQ